MGTEKCRPRSLLIKGASIITVDSCDTYFPRGDILICENRIHSVQESGLLSCADADIIIDGSGCVALPGFVNAHSHIGMSYQRGFADDIRLYEFLDRTFPVQRSASEEDIYIFALVACAELIKSGYTSICDIMEGLPATVRAITQAGIRGKLSPNIVDFGDAARVSALADYNRRMYEQYHNTANGRIRIDFNLHAPYSCSEQLIRTIGALASGYGGDLHIHLSENREEVAQVLQRTGKTPTAYLEQLGILGPNLLAAHFVKVTSADIELAEKYKLRIAHNPASNLKLASGFAPIPELVEKNICVGLGTDSCVTNNSFNAFETMKLTALIHKATHEDATLLPAPRVLRMATADGATAIGLGAETGSIEPGKLADLSLLRMESLPEFQPYYPSLPQNVISNIVYSATPAVVQTVIADGNLIMHNRELLTIDETWLLSEAKARAAALLRRAGVL